MIEGNGVEVSMDVSGCAGQVNNVLYMEHVQAKVTMSYSRRGDIKLNLISPSGTKSTLLPVSFWVLLLHALTFQTREKFTMSRNVCFDWNKENI